MKRLFMMMVVLIALNGCVTTKPSEFSLSADSDPHNGWEIVEVTGGLKWKLK